MNGKNVAVGTIVLAALAGVVLVGNRYARLGEELRAAEEARRGSDRRAAELEARLAAAAAELESARAEIARLGREAETARAGVASAKSTAAAKPSSAEPPAPPKAKGAGGMIRMMAAWQKTMNGPAMRKRMREGVRSRIDQQYDELFKEWGLEGESRKTVVDALADREMGQQELQMMLMDESVSGEDILRKQEEILGSADASLASVLTDAQRARMEAYDREQEEKRQGQAREGELAALKLDAARQEQVRAILEEERRNAPPEPPAFAGMSRGRGGARGGAPRLTAESVGQARDLFHGGTSIRSGMEDYAKQMSGLRERILSRVQPLLTPEQYETLKKQGDNEAAQLEMGIEMIRAFGDQPSPDSPDVSQKRGS